MPHHNRRNPRDALESLHQNNRTVTDAVDRLKNKTTHTVQVNDVENDVQDPIEGEVRIDHTDDKIAWYVNEAWHKPTGGIPAFAALYDDLIMGQWVGDTAVDGHDVTLVFPFGVLSSNAGGVFSFTTSHDAEYDMEIVHLIVHVNGIFTISHDLDWDPDNYRTHTRFYTFAPDAPPTWDFPGRLAANGGVWSDYWRDAEGLNQWYGPIVNSFTVHYTYPEHLLPFEMAFGFIGYDWEPGPSQDSIIGAKRVWVTYHGDPGLEDEYNPSGF